MTVITPETGLRAQLLRLARGAVAFAIVLGICGMGAAPSYAATDAQSEEGFVELFMSVGLNGAVAPGTATTAELTVQNGADAELSAGRVVLELGRTALSDGASLSAWLDEGVIDAVFTPLGSDGTTSVEPGASSTTSITVPQESLADLTPGVYPLRATLSGTDGADSDPAILTDVASRSVLIVTAAPAPQVGVLVPITATPASGSLLTLDELVALTAPDGALTAQLEGVVGTAAALAIDPAIPAAIRALGTSAPGRVVEWLARLEALPNERFALQFGDADAATQAHAALPALLQPTTLRAFLDPKLFPSAPNTASPEPTPSPTPEPAVPDDTALTTVTGAMPGILWPRGDVTGDDLATFAGYLGGPATTILPSTSIDERVSGHAVAGENDLLITDAAMSAALSAAAAEPDTDARAGALAAANGHLFLAAQSAPGVPLLIGLERDETRTAAALRAAISAVDTPAFDLSALRSAAPSAVTLTAAPDASRATALQAMLADEVTLNAFSTILDEPQLLLGPERIQILRVIAVGKTDDEFTTAVDEHRTATQTTLGSVGIEPTSTIQLFGANADFGFWVRNDLPWPVNVRLLAQPSDLRLDVQRETEARADAASNTRVKVPVSARVGSGELDVRLSLKSPTGVDIGTTRYADVSVRAEWETIGLVIFGGLAALLIVVGVVRTVRRRRRNDADAAAEDVKADAEAAPLEEEH
ncbi:DUF6049 family protein [Microbacterium aurantiacum]|uniref:DUF6049 family protein n=1 Tax=Microbacterium aurantiacum TaxID=162393 RepID=UPI000C8085D1|nr:DUF6049 family protein [Microbacterium aurantiacum]